MTLKTRLVIKGKEIYNMKLLSICTVHDFVQLQYSPVFYSSIYHRITLTSSAYAVQSFWQVPSMWHSLWQVHLCSTIFDKFHLCSTIFAQFQLCSTSFAKFHLCSTIFAKFHLCSTIFAQFHLCSSIFAEFLLCCTIFGKFHLCSSGFCPHLCQVVQNKTDLPYTRTYSVMLFVFS